MKQVAEIIEDIRYRPEVDGLRAIAVLAVVIFHTKLGLSGGFIGVDVFFVISGFLITSSILSDMEKGRFTMVGFWERRVRRILPALVVVVIATQIAGWFLLLPGDYAALGSSAVWQAAFGANLYYWRVTLSGYFSGSSDELPLLHTWSLAVEEQFYLFFPLILTTFVRFTRQRTCRALLSLFVVGILVSFFGSLYFVAYYRIGAFYLLPTRAWELLIGAALAVVPLTWKLHSRPVLETLSYVGLVGILAPAFFYTSETPFPGLAALPPCIGAALLIWSTNHNTAEITLKRILGSRPLVFIGLISYSLYLWHWPVCAYSNYYLSGETTATWFRISLIALAIILGWLSWRFVETPFRQKNICGSRKGIFVASAVSLVVTIGLGALTALSNGFPQRLPATIRASLDSNPKDDFLFADNIDGNEVSKGQLTEFGFRDASLPVSVLVWGDSHAMSILPAFDSILKSERLSGRAVTYSATPPVLKYFKEDRWGLGKESPIYQEAVISYIEKNRIPNVVLISGWRNYQTNTTGSVETALLKTVERLVQLGCQPWVFLDTPGANCDVRKVLRRATLLNLNDPRFCSSPSMWNGIHGNDPALIGCLTKAGARIIDPRPAFLNPSGDFYFNAIGGAVIYRDRGHLTKLGAERVIIPVLQKSFLPHLSPRKDDD